MSARKPTNEEAKQLELAQRLIRQFEELKLALRDAPSGMIVETKVTLPTITFQLIITIPE